ncbi:MAG: acyl-CoA dehydrogenase [Oscillospiraceae bacterium]|nr:acyl-CoA dehydrogenase [Oscillospiraceae bacterium]
MTDYKTILFEQMLKDFAENEVKPLAQEIDEEERFPAETVAKMAKLGLFGIIIPRQYGGAGAGYREYIFAVEEISKHCGTTGVVLSAHTSLCAAPILEFGTEEQKQKYLPDLATGRKLGGFGLTEPNAGTDAGNQQTTAVELEDCYLLNGSKIFITNGGEAATYVVIAVTGKGPKGPEMTAFIVEKGWEGFTFGKHEKKMGIRGSATCELIFENVRVPKENLLGKRGEGFKIAMKTLDGGRIGIAAQALGIAEGALETTVAYIKSRKQFGRPLSAFQNTQFQLADMATKTAAARALVYIAADAKQNKLPTLSVNAAQAKLFASETAMEVTTKAVQLHGGYGYTREYPVERMMRDAKITEIYEGTSEVQRMVISGALLKK